MTDFPVLAQRIKVLDIRLLKNPLEATGNGAIIICTSRILKRLIYQSNVKRKEKRFSDMQKLKKFTFQAPIIRKLQKMWSLWAINTKN